MKSGSKEFYEMMDQFERDLKTMPVYTGSKLDKEQKEMWLKGIYYCNGRLNDLFIGYMYGYSNAKSLTNS